MSKATLLLKDKQVISEYIKERNISDEKKIEEIRKIVLKNKGLFRYKKHHPDDLLESEQYHIYIFNLLDEKLGSRK